MRVGQGFWTPRSGTGTNVLTECKDTYTMRVRQGFFTPCSGTLLSRRSKTAQCSGTGMSKVMSIMQYIGKVPFRNNQEEGDGYSQT